MSQRLGVPSFIRYFGLPLRLREGEPENLNHQVGAGGELVERKIGVSTIKIKFKIKQHQVNYVLASRWP